MRFLDEAEVGTQHVVLLDTLHILESLLLVPSIVAEDLSSILTEDLQFLVKLLLLLEFIIKVNVSLPMQYLSKFVLHSIGLVPKLIVR